MENPIYEVESGLNSKLQPCIKFNEHTYNSLIDECKFLVYDAYQKGMLKDFVTNYPAITMISKHPKTSELRKQN